MSFIYFVIGLAPILWLAFALMVLKMPTYKAACGSLIASIVLATSQSSRQLQLLWKVS